MSEGTNNATSGGILYHDAGYAGLPETDRSARWKLSEEFWKIADDWGARDMAKDPDEIFDLDAIASRNIAEANLRAKAFDLAMRLSQWEDEPSHRPSRELARLADRIFRWFHTGEWTP